MTKLKSHPALLILVCILESVQTQPATIRIGGIMANRNLDVIAFKQAVAYVNSKKIIGPSTTLEYVLKVTTEVINRFESIQFACNQLTTGISAFIGPMSSTPTKAIHPVAHAHNIPQIAPIATNPMLGSKDNFPYLVRMSAPDSVQAKALIDLVKYFGWTKMAILTSNTDYGTYGMVEFQAQAALQQWRIVSVQQFVVGSDPNTVDAKTQLDYIKDTGVRVIILNCLEAFGRNVMKQAEEKGMLGAGWAWVVTDGITGSVPAPVGPFQPGLIGTSPSAANGALWTDFKNFITANGVTDKLDVDADGITGRIKFNSNVAPANPIFDIVNLKSGGWKKVGYWTELTGLNMTGSRDVRFQGGQESVTDYVSDLANKTLRFVTIAEEPFVIVNAKQVKNVSDIQPHEIEGYVIDIIKNLSQTIGFKYTMYLVPDGNFGSKNKVTGQWNGMVKELVDRRSDMAAASFTINREREEDIDFTKPYLDLGMRFVMGKDAPKESDPFRFLEPFDLWVYIAILSATLFVALHVSLLNKLSPYDYHGEFMQRDFQEIVSSDRTDEVKQPEIAKPLPMNRLLKSNLTKVWLEMKRKTQKELLVYKKEKKHALNKLNVANAVWLSTASLLQQGGEVYPKSLAARIPIIVWWIAIVILVATYTANLAAFLTAGRLETSINSIEDLGGQQKVLYGTAANTAPYTFFKDSNVTLYRDMADFMKTRDTLVKTTVEGFARARQKEGAKYAFIWDSAVLDYIVEQKPCDLQNVGRLFSKFGYGLGLQKNSPYRDIISVNILRLREWGFMDDLSKKWFKERGECSSREVSQSAEEEDGSNGKVGVDHMLGVFYVVLGGLALSLVVLVLEWIVFCFTTLDKSDPTKPHTFREALALRLSLLMGDIREEWFPCNVMNKKQASDAEKNPKSRPPSSCSKRGQLGLVKPVSPRTGTKVFDTQSSRENLLRATNDVKDPDTEWVKDGHGDVLSSGPPAAPGLAGGQREQDQSPRPNALETFLQRRKGKSPGTISSVDI